MHVFSPRDLAVNVVTLLIICAAIAKAVVDPHQSIFDGCGHYTLSQDVDQPGMHFLCVRLDSALHMHVSVLWNGRNADAGAESHFQFIAEASSQGVAQMFKQMQMQMLEHAPESSQASATDGTSRWKAFSTDGSELISLDRLTYEEVSVVYTNGNFMYPGVKVGHITSTKYGELTTLSLQPLVLALDNFLSSEECSVMKELAAPHLLSSSVVLKDGDLDKPAEHWRTSRSYFLSQSTDKHVAAIDARAAALTHTRVQQQEAIQVVHYREGEFYGHHHDFFDPQDYTADSRAMALTKHGAQNRFATLLFYLNAVDSGGETNFPSGFQKDQFDCSTGLSVRPETGKAVLFYDMHADGSLDMTSLHGACAVGAGELGVSEKWAANKWIWSDTFTNE